jgi:hypothetical protein
MPREAQEWAEMLGGVLATAEITGMLANRSQLLEEADEESRHVRDFLAAWWSQYGRTPVSTKELLPLATFRPLDITAKSEQGMLAGSAPALGRDRGAQGLSVAPRARPRRPWWPSVLLILSLGGLLLVRRVRGGLATPERDL